MKLFILICLSVSVLAKIEPTNKSFHPTSEFSIKRLIINNYNKLFFKNSDDPMEDILYKLVEKIIPYILVFDDFDSLIVKKLF